MRVRAECPRRVVAVHIIALNRGRKEYQNADCNSEYHCSTECRLTMCLWHDSTLLLHAGRKIYLWTLQKIGVIRHFRAIYYINSWRTCWLCDHALMIQHPWCSLERKHRRNVKGSVTSNEPQQYDEVPGAAAPSPPVLLNYGGLKQTQIMKRFSKQKDVSVQISKYLCELVFGLIMRFL